MPTKPYSPSEAAPVAATYDPPVPRFPRAARLPVVFFLVSMPVSAATPLPAGVVDVEGEALEGWRAAS